MAPLMMADPHPSSFQHALRKVLETAWSDPEVAQHAFFKCWAQRAGVEPLSAATLCDYCLKVERPNLALIHITDIVVELDWPAARTRNAVHRSVIEVVELMTLVLCERRIQKEIQEKKLLEQTVTEQGHVLVLPMENRLAACMVAAAWLQLRVKLVLDESGQPTALNLLTDLPPQEFGWTDARDAAKAEVMAYLNHVRGGEVHRLPSARRDQLAVVGRRGVLSDDDLNDHLQVHVSKGGALPTFGMQKNTPASIDDGIRVWLRDTFRIECFMVDPSAAAQAGAEFKQLQGFLLQHLEDIITRVHAGTRSDSIQREGKMANSTRKKVFISYSHADEDWREKLRVILKPQEKKGLLDVWDDKRIRTGDKWRTAIDTALAECRVAVLLVSSNFLASDFIGDEELPRIFARHESEGLWIYPILISSCDWKGEDLLKELQMKHCSGDAFDLAEEAQRNKAFAEVAAEIRTRLSPVP